MDPEQLEQIFNDATEEAAVEAAVNDVMELLGVDRRKAIAVLQTINVIRTKDIERVLDAGLSGGMNDIHKEIQAQLYMVLKQSRIFFKLLID